MSDFTTKASPGPGVAVTQTVLPATCATSGANGQNQGFYVLGPDSSKNAFPGTPTVTSTCERSEMTFTVPVANMQPTAITPPSILLQRLACPNLAPQTDPTKPNYNPYVTVDYVEQVPVFNAAKVGITAPNNPPMDPLASRASYGRQQPYAADKSQQANQAPAPATSGPQHTFFNLNVPNQPVFDWWSTWTDSWSARWSCSRSRGSNRTS